MAQTVTEVVRRRLVALRKARGLTNQAALSERMDEVGHPMHETAIARIESGRRDVKLDEIVAFAAALNVPLPVLLLPLDSGGDVALTPTTVVKAWEAYEWLVAREPLGDAHGWAEHTRVLRVYERLLAAQASALTACYRVESAEALGRDADRFIEDWVEALEELATAMRDLADAGADPKELVDRRLAKAIRDRGIVPRKRRIVRLGSTDEED